MNSSCRKKYIFFILAYIFVLSIIPAIFRNIIPRDMIENLYWGKELQLGYAKHPPLFSWITFGFYNFFGNCDKSLYFLTQINLLIGFYFVYQVTNLIFADKQKSFASVLIFMASICFVFGNEKFNATTILMSLYPIMFFFFIRMIKFHKYIDAIMLGIVSALACVGKYIALGYLGCMALFVFIDSETRNILKTPLPYITTCTFLICISWHISWMFDNNFITLKYALDKSTNATKNYFSCFNFLVMQVLLFFTSFLVFAGAYIERLKFIPTSFYNYTKEERFVIFITLIPNVLLFTVSLITGMRIGSFWGANMMMLLGTYLLVINKHKLDYKKLFNLVVKISIIFACILTIKLGVRPLLGKYDIRNVLDISAISEKIDRDWRAIFKNEKMVVLKSDKPLAFLHYSLPDSPSSYNAKTCNLFDLKSLYPNNTNTVLALICKTDDPNVKEIQNIYGSFILFQNTIKISDNQFVYYAFINVKEPNGI